MTGSYVCITCRNAGKDFRVPADEIGAALMREHLRTEHTKPPHTLADEVAVHQRRLRDRMRISAAVWAGGIPPHGYAMSEPVPYMKRPCGECPWRVDALPGRFPACRYDALRDTSGSAGHEAHFGAPIFACHKSTEGTDRACAGWLAVVGYEHLGMRFAAMTGRLPPDIFITGEDWPELFGSYEEMAQANGADGVR